MEYEIYIRAGPEIVTFLHSFSSHCCLSVMLILSVTFLAQDWRYSPRLPNSFVCSHGLPDLPQGEVEGVMAPFAVRE